MKNENSLDSIISIEKKVNYRAIFEKYSYYKKWFLISILISILLAFIYLRYTPNQYSVNTIILIDAKESGGIANELSAFEDLVVLSKKKTTLDTEMTVLKSRTLIQKTLKKLRLNVSYKNVGSIRDKELYHKTAPYKVNFLSKDSLFYLLDTSFKISTESISSYLIHNADNEIEKKYGFGEIMSTEFGDVIITPNDVSKVSLEDEMLVTIKPLNEVANEYKDMIQISPESKESNTLIISLNDNNKNKAQDILNELVKQYNLDAIEDKRIIARNTDRFITERIEDISKDLEIVDKGVEEYKIDNQLSDIEKEAGLILESNSELEKEIVDLTSQIKLIEYVSEYMDENQNDIIPSNLGLKDERTSQSTLTYNQLLLERNRIIKNSSALNPTVVNLESQITTLRESIERSLLNLKRSLTYSLNEARSQERRLNAKKAKAPKQEREFQDIKRKQQIVETLYLYLLQKREENAIKLAVPEPNAKIIDLADGDKDPVFPKKRIIYVIAGILGIFFPIVIISISELFDNKIHTIEDIEDEVQSPILGDIPLIKSNETKIISHNDSSNVAEAFRLLRTNLNFMLPRDKEGAKTIFVSSTIPGEGKTLVAANLAISLGLLNKKVLLIGSDIRKPSLDKYLNLDTCIGLTKYLIDSNLKTTDIIEPSSYDNVDIIQSGDIPPNPSELLLNGRFELVLEFGKENYEYVIIDTAPVNVVTDTLQLAHHADLFIYVMRANYLDKRLLKVAKLMQESKRLPNMAILLNATNYRKKGYGYGGNYGYQEEELKKSLWKRFGLH